MQIIGLSVWSIEPNNPQPTGFGVMGSKDLAENPDAVKLCVEFIRKLWDYDVDRTDTRVHVFETAADKVDHAEDVKMALWEIGREINLRANSELVATWVSESHWAQRYVLLIISFENDGHTYVALVLTESAKEETFLITREKLVSELEDIFKRVIYKGIIYPYFDDYADDLDEGRAKVYQASPAQYILVHLGLVPQITPTQLLSEALKIVVREGTTAYDFTTLADHLIEAAATAHEQTPQQMTEVIQAAPVNVSIDGIKVQTSLRDILDRRVTIVGIPGQYVVSIHGTTVDLKSGSHAVRLEDLLREG